MWPRREKREVPSARLQKRPSSAGYSRFAPCVGKIRPASAGAAPWKTNLLERGGGDPATRWLGVHWPRSQESLSCTQQVRTRIVQSILKAIPKMQVAAKGVSWSRDPEWPYARPLVDDLPNADLCLINPKLLIRALGAKSTICQKQKCTADCSRPVSDSEPYFTLSTPRKVSQRSGLENGSLKM